MEDITPLPFGFGLPAVDRAPSFAVSVAHHELMTLMLAGHAYGIPVGCVVDVRDPQPRVEFFNRPACIVGSLWIAGEHAPVIDLRLALGLQPERGSRSPVIAIDVGERVIGVAVDSVGDVFGLRADSLAKADATAGPIEPRFLFGEGRSPRGEPLSVLDMVAWMQHLNELFEITST